MEHAEEEQSFRGCLPSSEFVFSQIPLPELLKRLDLVHFVLIFGWTLVIFALESVLSFPA